MLGNLNVTNRGRIIDNFRIDPEDVDGKGHPLSSFFVFMIVAAAMDNIREPYHPVLKGEFDRTGISVNHTDMSVNRTDKPAERTDKLVHRDGKPAKYTDKPVRRNDKSVGRTDMLAEHTSKSVRRDSEQAGRTDMLAEHTVKSVQSDGEPVGRTDMSAEYTSKSVRKDRERAGYADISANRTAKLIREDGELAEHTDILAEHTDKLVQNDDELIDRTDMSADRTAKSVQNVDESYNDYYITYVHEMAARHIRNKDSFRRLIPFDETWIADNWRRVDTANAGIALAVTPSANDVSTAARRDAELPLQFPVASSGAAVLINRYGHYIFAYNDDYLLLGVPGMHSDEDRPDGGESGFTVWQPVKGSEVYGYWLTAIERETGNIVGV